MKWKFAFTDGSDMYFNVDKARVIDEENNVILDTENEIGADSLTKTNEVLNSVFQK